MEDVQLQALKRVVQTLIDFENRNHRNISERFHLFKIKRENPDFYQRIKNPRQLSSVRYLLHDGQYKTPVQVYQDLKLVFLQGQDYSKRSSEAYRDASRMNSAVDEVWESEAMLPAFDKMGVVPTGEVEEEVVARKRERLTAQEAENMRTFGKETDQLHAAYLQKVLKGIIEDDIPSMSTDKSRPETSTREPSREPSPIVPEYIEEPMRPAPNMTLTRDDASTQLNLSPRTKQHVLESLANYAPSVPPTPSTSHIKVEQSLELEQEDDDEGLQNSTSQPKGATLPGDTQAAWLKATVDVDQYTVFYQIMRKLKSEIDPRSGRVLCRLIASAPSQEVAPAFYRLTDAITLDKVEQRLVARYYTSPEMFDADLAQMFKCARTWIRPERNLEAYGDVMALQRLYQEVTRDYGLEAMNQNRSTLSLAAKNSSTLAKIRPEDVRGSQDKIYFDSVQYKGEVLKIGDYIHIFNHDNHAKPLIGQIFRTFKRISTERRYVNVCWYLRPEETVHPLTRTFYEHEVCKSSSYVDHPVEDFMERCLIMFHSKYVKGRPKPPLWNVEMPTYVVEQRYKDKAFKKIKNWSTCVPDEVKAIEQNPDLLFFKDPPKALPKVRSPFAKLPTDPSVGSEVSTIDATHDVFTARSQAVSNMTAQTPVSNSLLRKSESSPEYAATGGAIERPMSFHQSAADEDQFDPLPELLSSQFRSDPGTGELLWFTSPPVAIPPVASKLHGLEYLYWKASRPKDVPSSKIIPRKRNAMEALEQFVDRGEVLELYSP